MSFTLPDLPYTFGALEPYLDKKTMSIHHGKHHASYVEKLNKSLTSFPKLSQRSLEDLLANLDKIPKQIRESVRNNGGGHINHSLFWEIMSPNVIPIKSGHLLGAINSEFGSFSSFQDKFSDLAGGHFGSGWAWLVAKDEKLDILITANQNTPISKGLKPILGLDLWEHAYYLKYQNRRPDYIKAWWHVVHWEKVEELFLSG